MTIKQCYDKMGADYTSICERFGDESLVVKFATRFPDDRTYDRLCEAVEKCDWRMAFRLVHTLKGVAANLSLTHLTQAASVMTDDLRDGNALTNEAIWESVQVCYEEAVSCIKEYIEMESLNAKDNSDSGRYRPEQRRA